MLYITVSKDNSIKIHLSKPDKSNFDKHTTLWTTDNNTTIKQIWSWVAADFDTSYVKKVNW